MNGFFALFLVGLLSSGTASALNSAKRVEARAQRISLKIKKLASDKSKKNYSPLYKQKAPKPAPLDKIPAAFPQPSRQAQYRIVRVHNWIAKGERILKATPSMFPVRGRISSQFGLRVHPKTREERNHLGIDIVAKEGAPVFATADGRVMFSGKRRGYGKVVVVDHGFGFQTVYAHNSRLSVYSGALVKRGQVIARVGSTGHTTGPHLHYEIRKNGEPIDPRFYLKPRRGSLETS